jgi:hypothetical protein
MILMMSCSVTLVILLAGVCGGSGGSLSALCLLSAALRLVLSAV